MASKKDKIDKYAQGMFVRQEQYAQRVKAHYDKAVEKLLDLARQVKDDVGEDKAFTFSDNPRVRDEATMAIRQLYSQVYQEIRGGVEAEWEYANLSCDAMVMAAFGKGCKENDLFARFFERNKEAMNQFFKRKNGFGGLNLSQKVWKYTGDLRTEMENAITVSLGEGVSASTMSRRVRQYLQEPERLYRRVRGADGKLHLSKAAKAYHPGRGVYRSSYKNAMRLTRTETNAAYRLADEDRWQRMDFVVGMRVHKSNNHPTEDICDVLAGDYPKDFKFSAWHPQCRCYVTSILCTKEEMIQMQKNILAGNDAANAGFHSVNEVRTVPKAFKDWVENNQDRIVRAKALPYFLRDNGKVVDGKWVCQKPTADAVGTVAKEGMLGGYRATVNKIVHSSELHNLDEYKPRYTPQQKTNSANVATRLGIEVQDDMLFSQADNGRVNPKYSFIKKFLFPNDLSQYNCTFTSDVLELRMRGVDVIARLYDDTNTAHRQMARAYDIGAGWINPATGEKAIAVPLRNKKVEKLLKSFDEYTKEEGHYKVAFFDSNTSGHVFSAIRTPDGNITFYDGQNNEINFKSWKKQIHAKKGLKVLRLDDKIADIETITEYIEKSGYKSK